MNTIDHYKSIAQASADMLDAARDSDWDELVSAEEKCAHRIAALQMHQEGGLADTADGAGRIRILGEILAHDAEIRDLTTPWLRQLEQILAAGSQERRLQNTYRSDT